MQLKLTQHAKERYARRIMNREEKLDIAVFVAQHEDKIFNDISKMVEYGEQIYEGPSISEYNREPVTVILNGSWILILDKKTSKVVTLYKIDLGLGKEFNDSYISKLKEKLENSKKQFEETSRELDETITVYKDCLAQNEAVIDDYRRIINELEAQNKNYKEIIDYEETNKYVAGQEIRETVGVFVGRKVF